MEYLIQPTTVPKTAVRIKIDVGVILDEKAIIRVSFYEADMEFQPIDMRIIYIEGEEYKAWGNDDKYIKDIVFKKLGIKIA
jgi:hypothetical protein